MSRRIQLALFAVAVVAALVLGIAKTEAQRQSPPTYAQKPEHLYDGFVSIDGYSHRAAAMADRLRGAEPTLLDRPAKDLHPTALLVPFLTALLSLVVGSVPRAFQLLSFGALFGQLALVVWLARRMARESAVGREASDSQPASWDPGFLAGTLLAGHCLSFRTAGQLYLDPFCALAGLAALATAWQWARSGARGWWCAMAAVLLAGVFTKISFLPFLAAPALAVVAAQRSLTGSNLHSSNLRRPALFRPALFIAVATGVGALVVAWLFTRAHAERSSLAVDMVHLADSWNLTGKQLIAFALEMALLLQVLPVVLYLTAPRRKAGRSPWPPLGTTALALAALVLLSTWAFYLPAVARLYAPVLALLVPVVAAWVSTSALPSRRLFVALLAYVLANAAVGLAALAR